MKIKRGVEKKKEKKKKENERKQKQTEIRRYVLYVQLYIRFLRLD